MTMDANEHRGDAGFPVDQPMEALKADHHFVRQLFDRYLNTRDMNVKREAGPRAIMLVEMHSALEEGVFYPKVHQADPSLVDRCEDDHQQVKEMIAQLKTMSEDDPQFEQVFRQFADAVLRHVDIEERELFPKVEQANLDLTAIGIQMQMFESSMVAAQARDSGQPGMRQ